MDILTNLARLLLHYRVRAIRRYESNADSIQRRALEKLVRQAKDTQWGKEHGYAWIRSYEDFASRVPVGDYASLKAYILKMMEGEADVLWKGRVTRFVTSSGTTSDTVKFIPVSRQGLRHCHLRGGHDVTAMYLHGNRESHLARGFSLTLFGQLNSNYAARGLQVGDISAIMASASPRFFRKLLHLIPSTDIARITDTRAKYDALADLISRKKMVAFSGSPLWNLIVLERALEKTGAKTAEELWPGMELFAHGGVFMHPYRRRLETLFPSGKLHYMECYNASEGFFGIQTDLQDPAMTLMLDYEVFYEFIPMSVYGRPDARAVPLWEVELGVEYSMVVSTSSGLWRYDMGDIVRFTSKKPYRFVLTGRTLLTLDIWREDLSVEFAEKAMDEACRRCGAQVKEFTVAPVFQEEDPTVGQHQWLVEFSKEPADLQEFAITVDEILQRDGQDYKDYRQRAGGLMPEFIRAHPGLFYDWLEAKGSFGGQHKIPRILGNRQIMDQLLRMNT